MQAIFNFLTGILFPGIAALITSIWAGLKAAIEKYWWLFVTFMVGVFWIVVMYAQDIWNSLQGLISSALVAGFSFALPSGATTALCLLNHILPVTEFFTFLAAYLVVVGIVACYRLIKTLIPTVAGV
ncbi:MAG TPA: hypothetical protein VLK33_05205 [Terriglobales bacterium]|nr:hypothetical protein [Terriglobales bacterium]